MKRPDDCSDIETLKKSAKNRELDCCQECDRKSLESPVFAAGCPDHQTFISPFPKILFIFRDPHYETCKDGNVCGWCHDDSSANNFKKIYQILEIQERNGCPPIYCINAVLCGPKNGNSKPPAAVFKACSNVLKQYVRLLKSKLVVACGNEARNSLADAFELSRKEFEKKQEPVPVKVDNECLFLSTRSENPGLLRPGMNGRL